MHFSRTFMAAAAATTLAFAAGAASAQVRAGAAAGPVAIASTASTLVVDIAGWETFGTFEDPGNTQAFFDLGAGTEVLGFRWDNLVFESEGFSWQTEFTLSVNSTADEFIDAAPAFGTEEPGIFGPSSGVWGVDGLSFGQAPFTLPDGTLWVTVYESFDDAGRDALVSSGTLTIFYAPIPEPGTYGLMALGLLGVAAAARRRKVG